MIQPKLLSKGSYFNIHKKDFINLLTIKHKKTTHGSRHISSICGEFRTWYVFVFDW